MPPDHGVNICELLRQSERPTAAVQIGADGDDLGDASRRCAREDFVEVALEIRIIKMGVGVEKDRHTLSLSKSTARVRDKNGRGNSWPGDREWESGRCCRLDR